MPVLCYLLHFAAHWRLRGVERQRLRSDLHDLKLAYLVLGLLIVASEFVKLSNIWVAVELVLFVGRIALGDQFTDAFLLEFNVVGLRFERDIAHLLMVRRILIHQLSVKRI